MNDSGSFCGEPCSPFAISALNSWSESAGTYAWTKGDMRVSGLIASRAPRTMSLLRSASPSRAAPCCTRLIAKEIVPTLSRRLAIDSVSASVTPRSCRTITATTRAFSASSGRSEPQRAPIHCARACGVASALNSRRTAISSSSGIRLRERRTIISSILRTNPASSRPVSITTDAPEDVLRLISHRSPTRGCPWQRIQALRHRQHVAARGIVVEIHVPRDHRLEDRHPPVLFEGAARGELRIDRLALRA